MNISSLKSLLRQEKTVGRLRKGHGFSQWLEHVLTVHQLTSESSSGVSLVTRLKVHELKQPQKQKGLYLQHINRFQREKHTYSGL